MPRDRRSGDTDNPATFGWRIAQLEDELGELGKAMTYENLDERYVTRRDVTAAGDRRLRVINLLLALAVVVEPVVLFVVAGGHA